MEAILIYVLISLSVSHMWSHSDIMGYMRRLVVKVPYIRRPLLCPECSSFWIGVLCCFLINPFTFLPIIVDFIVAGLVTHMFASALYKSEILS